MTMTMALANDTRLDRVARESQFHRRGSETITEWVIRVVDYSLASESELEWLRR